MAEINISLPHNWEPRWDQMGLWNYLIRGGLRADEVAHRRWGKDDVSLHWTCVAAHKRVGTYWHMLPEASQARKAIWDAINPRTGKRRIDEAFPKELRASTREQDMLIRFKNGSTWQVLGSDNYDSLVGSPPVGVVFSEWGLARPDAWTYIRPILLENGGWVVFIWTPRGRNHATRAFESRAKDDAWWTQKLRADQTPVFTAEQLAKERKELISELGSEEEGQSKFDTEYMVDFDASVPGAYFAAELKRLEARGGLKRQLFDPTLPVDTCWDLGIDDYTSIWFVQRPWGRVNLIDFYETSGDGLDSIVKYGLKLPQIRRGFKYGRHYLPHDVMVRELGAGGRTRRQTLNQLGVSGIRVGVSQDPEERINASRKMLQVTQIDPDFCETGIDHLRQYQKRWNASLGVYVGPLHNEHSHAADALGEYAVNANIRIEKKTAPSPNPVGDAWFRKVRQSVPNWKTV